MDFLPPDLLHRHPTDRLQPERLRSILTIAFSTGGACGELDELPVRKISTSGWAPEGYQEDLFLRELSRKLAKTRVDDHPLELAAAPLLTLLTSPARPEDVSQRHSVLRELTARPELRKELLRAHAVLASLRNVLAGSAASGRLPDGARRIQTLRSLREAFAILAGSFRDAQSDLSRIRTFGEAIQASDEHLHLEQLLNYEEQRTTLDLRIGVGSDGSIRKVELVRVEQAEQNPFFVSGWGRFVRAVLLWLRGARFGEDEVLAHAMDEVFDGLSLATTRLLGLIVDLEFYLSALGFAQEAQAAGLSTCLPELALEGERHLERLFNPLLLARTRAPVPSTFDFLKGQNIAIVTGPNSGGKTRTLQALGIAQLLAQTGYFVPAASAQMVWASGMLAAMRFEASAAQQEGHLGMELLRVKRVFEQMESGAFVLLDELCSGTNPAEAEEIFELVVELLNEMNAQAFVSTHFLDLAARLQQSPPTSGFAFLQMELDAERRPTYRLVPGVAHSALARDTAARLGVTREELRKLVR